jgi:hypothetical protein
MPWTIVKGSGQCPPSKPFGVAKRDTGEVVGCHTSQAEAQKQVAALYASEKEMSETNTNHMNHIYLVDASTLEFQETDGTVSSWVHALPVGTYTHPVYGKMPITPDRVQRFVSSVKNKVRGIDPSINYYHENNKDAAGWVKDAKAETDGLWLFVEWTKDAVEKIKTKAIKYFSSEIANEWTDPQGKKFQDVVFGGALTNRPFMKNLVPINLSEASILNAFELVAAIKGTDVESLKGGTESMDLTEDQLTAIATKVAESITEKLPKPQDQNPAPTPTTLNLTEVEELKQLAEENPLVAMLIKHVESTNSGIVETQKKLQETQIASKLSEFDNSKLVLTPVAKEKVYNLLIGMPQELHENFWDLMTHLKKSQAFLVELGERAGANVKLGGIGETAAKRFADETNKLMAEGKLSYADAVTQVSRDNPKLFEEYRQESFIPQS